MSKEHSNSLKDKLSLVVDDILKGPQNRTELFSAMGSAPLLFASILASSKSAPLLLLFDGFEDAERASKDLSFFCDEEKIGFFPPPDTFAYDNQSPDKEVVETRLACLKGMLDGRTRIVVTTIGALSQRLLPPESLQSNWIELVQQNTYPRNELIERLVSSGYSRVEMVEEKGEFAARGEIVDIFPVGSTTPIRLDFFDEELETIRRFDVETQESIEGLKQTTILPALEIVLDAQNLARFSKGIIGHKANTSPEQYHSLVERIENRTDLTGVESYLPLFYEKTFCLWDFFPKTPTLLFMDRDRVLSQADSFFEEVCHEYEYSVREGNPTLPPEKLYLSPKDLTILFGGFEVIDLQRESAPGPKRDLGFSDNNTLRTLSAQSIASGKSPTSSIFDQFKQWHLEGARIALVVSSNTHAEQIERSLDETGLSVETMQEATPEETLDYLMEPTKQGTSNFRLYISPLSQGFRWCDENGVCKTALVTEEEIYGIKRKKSRLKKSGLKHFFSSLGDLKVKDCVVHVEYGIGTYEGMQKIKVGEVETDFLVIQYKDGDKVYVPVDKFHLVQKYTGGEVGRPRLDKLGDKNWAKTKSKIRTEIDDMAEELLAIYSERKAKKGIAFSPENPMTRDFALRFAYQETEDQEKAIEEVEADMEKPQPMDRLVCGDVGFGKTEVAMRAAFKAVVDGYQVGILVPTTILAQQHFETFKARFSNTAVSIGLLSRFQSPAQIKKTLKDLKEKKLDIVIGTHRLLSKDVIFGNLGFLVIDEEQRFGVRHKETIRKLRTTVDSLALSATPIPRTLHMSLVGIRDISVINSPPIDRRAIRTRLLKFSDYAIKEAVTRELRREGQVFFVHNRVESIYEIGQYLNHVLPRVRVGVAHGQMSEKDLERVMVDFIEKRYDVLLSTTIVESGLDIPNANTIIVNNADQFGLSQLYQLRGRVGRSKAQAYAYLLIPKEKVITELARKRLAILQELNHLGAGFKIANYDLELRGAGNLLGSQQSGHIAAVGFELYTDMIEEAIRKLRQEPAAKTKDASEIKLNLGIQASLPDSYISSMNQRLDAYKEIASCKNEDEIWATRHNLEDRFGKIPEKAINLFTLMEIKLLSSRLDIKQIDLMGNEMVLSFEESFQPDLEKLFGFIEEKKDWVRIMPNQEIRASLKETTSKNIIHFLTSLGQALKTESK